MKTFKPRKVVEPHQIHKEKLIFHPSEVNFAFLILDQKVDIMAS